MTFLRYFYLLTGIATAACGVAVESDDDWNVSPLTEEEEKSGDGDVSPHFDGDHLGILKNVYDGSIDAVKEAIRRGASIDERYGRIAPIMVAALRGDVNMLEYLKSIKTQTLVYLADPAVLPVGLRPLYCPDRAAPVLLAIAAGRVDAVNLLKGDIDDLPGVDGKTGRQRAIDTAINANQLDILHVLLWSEDDVIFALRTAARQADSAILESLLKVYSHLEDTRDESGYWLIHDAALYGQAGNVALLSKKQINVHARTTIGRTPLHLASLNGHIQAMDVLLQQGALASADDQTGATPSDMSEEGYQFITITYPLLHAKRQAELERAAAEADQAAKNSEIGQLLNDKCGISASPECTICLIEFTQMDQIGTTRSQNPDDCSCTAAYHKGCLPVILTYPNQTSEATDKPCCRTCKKPARVEYFDLAANQLIVMPSQASSTVESAGDRFIVVQD